MFAEGTIEGGARSVFFLFLFGPACWCSEGPCFWVSGVWCAGLGASGGLVSSMMILGMPLFPHSLLLFISLSGSAWLIRMASLICLPRLVFHDLSTLNLNLGGSPGWCRAWCLTRGFFSSSLASAVPCSLLLSNYVLWLSPQ